MNKDIVQIIEGVFAEMTAPEEAAEPTEEPTGAAEETTEPAGEPTETEQAA